METFLRAPELVDFCDLNLDPNNPRLSNADAPGYEDADALFNEELQKTAEEELFKIYKPDELVDSIINQGWMPIDNIVVWSHPSRPGKHVVVEGNTRTLALRRIRNVILPSEKNKLRRLESSSKKYTSTVISDQRNKVADLEKLVAETEKITVVPLAADSPEELEKKLPRVLAVRHIQGAKSWGGYAEDLWVYERYKHLFEDRFPGEPIKWVSDLIKIVADESSSKSPATRKKMMATSAYSHFSMNYEDQMPDGEKLLPDDYYLFEIIAKNGWLSEQFGLKEHEFYLSEEGEKALYEWVFKLARTGKGDNNPNVIYRHENIRDWAAMRKYDDLKKTNFSYGLDIDNPETATSYRSMEAGWQGHKANKQPQAVVDELIKRLESLNASELFNNGESFKDQLIRIRTQADMFIKAIEANEAN